MICSKCGNQIPAWADGVCYNCSRIKTEQQRYGHGRPKRHRPSWRRAIDRERVEGTMLIVPESWSRKKPRMSSNVEADQRLQRKGINDFLEDIYGHPRYLSNILRDAGLADGKIAQLRQSKLADFLSTLVQQWSLWFQDILSDGYCDLLVRRYSLDGQPAATVEELAVEYGTSRKHIKQLLTHARQHSVGGNMNTKLPRAPQRTTPGFAFSMIERSLFDCLGERQFGKAEMEEVSAFFGGDPPECVFCGSREVRRWDHLVPIRHGGESVLGNMVPACTRCDDSKQHLPFEEWMTSDANWSPKSRGIPDVEQRIQRIRAYAQQYNYEARSFDERLDQQEQERLAGIRENLQALRKEVEALIQDYRARTGNR